MVAGAAGHDHRKGEADGEKRERQGHQVGVEVAEQEGEEGELCYLVAGRVWWHDTRAAPEVERGGGYVTDEGIPDPANDLHGAVQVAKHHHEGGACESCGGGREGEAYEPGRGGGPWHSRGRPRLGSPGAPDGTGDAVGAAPAGEVVDDGVGRASGQGEEEGDGEVECDSWVDSRGPDEGSHHELAPVVVVDVAAGEPRIVGRHVARLQDGVEVGHVHGLLAAQVGVPQVGIGHADEDEGEEGGEEDGLARQQGPPSARDKGSDLAQVDGQEDEGRRRDRCHAQPNRRHREGYQLVAGQQPGDKAHEQQPEGLREEVAAIRQPAQHHEGYGDRQQ